MTTRQSNVTAAFIDLATFELLESTLYGGDTAITYFVREVQKCTWFSQIPVKLSSSGNGDFGADFGGVCESSRESQWLADGPRERS